MTLDSYTVALVGFSQKEALILESFLHLSVRQVPGYLVQDEVIDAQILIVNADNAQALSLVRHANLPGRVVLMGDNDGGTGWPLLRRPVKLASVLVQLNHTAGLHPTPGSETAHTTTDRNRPQPLVSQHLGLETAFPANRPLSGPAPLPMTPAPSPRRHSRDSDFMPTLTMGGADLIAPSATAAGGSSVKPAPDWRASTASTDALRLSVMRMNDVGPPKGSAQPSIHGAPSRRSGDSTLHSDQRSMSETPELARGDVLLVAQSLVEGRTLLRRFTKYELSVDWSRESAQALVMLKAHRYRMVVIDLSSQPETLQVCRAAKQEKHNGRAPTVIVFAATDNSMDRVKIGLAGCDACLSPSVSEADLYKLLVQHRFINLNPFAKNNPRE